MSKEGAAKTLKAVNAAKHGATVKARKVHNSPRFHRPQTKRIAPKDRTPPIVGRNKMDNYRIVHLPLNTEKALRELQNNVVTFLCDPRATKPQIAAAVTARFNVKVIKVNTLIRPDCKKKAYVKLHESCDAAEVFSKLGLL